MNLDRSWNMSKLPAQNVLKVPDNVDYIEAAMVEPSAVVAHGFLKSNIQPGMTVAVMGCGSIGFVSYSMGTNIWCCTYHRYRYRCA